MTVSFPSISIKNKYKLFWRNEWVIETLWITFCLIRCNLPFKQPSLLSHVPHFCPCPFIQEPNQQPVSNSQQLTPRCRTMTDFCQVPHRQNKTTDDYYEWNSVRHRFLHNIDGLRRNFPNRVSAISGSAVKVTVCCFALQKPYRKVKKQPSSPRSKISVLLHHSTRRYCLCYIFFIRVTNARKYSICCTKLACSQQRRHLRWCWPTSDCLILNATQIPPCVFGPICVQFLCASVKKKHKQICC